jgi:hypothetical protein
VDKQTQALYKRLFSRSVLVAGIVFGLANLVDPALATGGSVRLVLALLALPITFVGYALVEGALVQVVRDLHEDGDRRSSLAETFSVALARFKPLASVSLRTGFGVLLGCLLLIVPGLLLLTRWAVAIPVVMLEGLPAPDAMRRSQELVRGNGRAVFTVVLSIGFVTGIVNLLFSALARGHGFPAVWLAGTVSAALTVPYAAHAMTVLYYRLTEPERPVVQEPGGRWQSIWDAQRAAAASAEH